MNKRLLLVLTFAATALINASDVSSLSAPADEKSIEAPKTEVAKKGWKDTAIAWTGPLNPIAQGFSAVKFAGISEVLSDVAFPVLLFGVGFIPKVGDMVGGLRIALNGDSLTSWDVLSYGGYLSKAVTGLATFGILRGALNDKNYAGQLAGAAVATFGNNKLRNAFVAYRAKGNKLKK
jgi:hypothetical protein